MVQSALHRNGQRKRKRGESTSAGRRSQITHKLTHGIRGVSPVLLGVEREEDWQTHYEGIVRSLVPGDPYEASLIHKIAWQLWRLDRVIRTETALTIQKIHTPPESIYDTDSRPTVTKESILEAIAALEKNGNSHNGEASRNSLLSRLRAFQSGAADIMFDPVEVREILTLVLEQVRASKTSEPIDEDLEIEGDDDREEEENFDEEFTIEERRWSAGEVAEQLRILSTAAEVDWHEEITSVIQSLKEVQKEHQAQHEEARRHVLRNLILGERTVTRLSLYERQIMSQLKATYSLLERARGWRLGMPVPPPVSVDLTISKGHDSNGV
jgi:hypothetical protein